MIRVTTVTLVDLPSDTRKFYRAYADEVWCVLHWGRIDSAGRFKATQGGQVAATAQIEKKISGSGYGDRVDADWEHEFPSDFTGSAEQCQRLVDHHANPVAAPEAPKGDRLVTLMARTRKALKAGDDHSGQVAAEHAGLAARCSELQDELDLIKAAVEELSKRA